MSRQNPLPEGRPAIFANATQRLLIGGEWVSPATHKSFETFNPATGEVITRIAEGDRPMLT